MIVLDTSILSLAWRRASPPAAQRREVEAFIQFVQDDEPMAVPSIVLQALLSGVKTGAAFTRLDEALGGFPLLLPTRELHVSAARLRNTCRAHGVAAATVDCLIAAHTLAVRGQLFTLDDDFGRIAKHTGLKILSLPPPSP